MKRLGWILVAVTLVTAFGLLAVGCGGDDDATDTTQAMEESTDTTAAMDEEDSGGDMALMDGPTVYANNCASCHGDAGQGDSAPALAGSGIDAATVEDALGQEQHGFAAALPAEEIQAVADYVANELGQ